MKLGSGLKSIGRAFLYCESLHEIELPDSVETIRNGAFTGCEDIRVTYRGRVYTQENLNEIYDDTPLPKHFGSRMPPHAYPDWDYAIPNLKNNYRSFGHYPIDASAIPKLPVIRNDENITLPEEYDKYLLPEKRYRVNDRITDLTGSGKTGSQSGAIRPTAWTMTGAASPAGSERRSSPSRQAC